MFKCLICQISFNYNITRFHPITIDKSNRIIKSVVVRRMPSHLLRQWIHIHPFPQSWVIIPPSVIIPIKPQLVLELFSVVSIHILRLGYVDQLNGVAYLTAVEGCGWVEI